MKSLSLKTVVSALGAVALSAVLVLMLAPAPSTAGIVGTDHDLSGAGYGTSEICVFCHAPHNAVSQDGPLWNHEVTTATFTLYSSSTLNATLGQPDGPSKLCLSCHDGTVAIDSFGGNTGTNFMTGDHKLTTDLTDDHPISFVYDAALATADGELVTPQSATWVDTAQTLPLYSSKLQCATCHNVHDDTNGKFLRVANTGSALCLKCHAK